MKGKILILIILALLSCGSREKQLNKENKQEYGSIKTEGSEESSGSTSEESKVDFTEFMKQSGLKITSTGSPFKLSYNGINFEGDANIDFNQNERKTVIISVTKVQTTYKSKITYKSVTNWKTKYKTKDLNVKSERSSWWLYVLLFFAGAVAGTALFESIKSRMKIF